MAVFFYFISLRAAIEHSKALARFWNLAFYKGMHTNGLNYRQGGVGESEGQTHKIISKKNKTRQSLEDSVFPSWSLGTRLVAISDNKLVTMLCRLLTFPSSNEVALDERWALLKRKRPEANSISGPWLTGGSRTPLSPFNRWLHRCVRFYKIRSGNLSGISCTAFCRRL